MGIAGLWDVLGDGEICSIADYAARHFEQHKSPLRIAVDEACWRFTNLTPEQVQKIQEGEPAANPVEKVILWRILRLLKLNIQLIFVNDGPRRPWKRGKRGGGKLDFELTRLTHQLLDKLKVPHHRAPGEAEAECARLQALGIVDAIWSDDGDAFMFGCGTLIKQHKVGKDRVKDHVKVFYADTIRKELDLDSDSLVLFAMLAGGDYSTDGLRGCGPKTAAIVAKREHGLARALCHASQGDLPQWRQMLQDTLRKHGKSIDVPLTFPDWKAVCHYRSPTVSSHEQLHNLRGLKNGLDGWDQPIDQRKLRVMLRERFNFTTREFMKHITPIFMIRALARATPQQKAENLAFGIRRKRTRKKKQEDGEEQLASELKITFSPMPVVEVDLSERPPEEDWAKFEKADKPYDPTQDIECEVLDCFLRHGLPNGALDQPPEPVKTVKRKRQPDGDLPEGSQSSKKARRNKSTPKIDGQPPDAEQLDTATLVPKKRGRPRKQAEPLIAGSASATRAKKAHGSSPSLPNPETRPTPVFKQPRALPISIAEVVDLCVDDSGSDTEASDDGVFVSQVAEPPLQSARGVSMQAPAIDERALVPGEVISREALRGLRDLSTLLKPHQPLTPPQSTLGQRNNSTSRTRHALQLNRDVIDLT